VNLAHPDYNNPHSQTIWNSPQLNVLTETTSNTTSISLSSKVWYFLLWTVWAQTNETPDTVIITFYICTIKLLKQKVITYNTTALHLYCITYVFAGFKHTKEIIKVCNESKLTVIHKLTFCVLLNFQYADLL